MVFRSLAQFSDSLFHFFVSGIKITWPGMYYPCWQRWFLDTRNHWKWGAELALSEGQGQLSHQRDLTVDGCPHLTQGYIMPKHHRVCCEWDCFRVLVLKPPEVGRLQTTLGRNNAVVVTPSGDVIPSLESYQIRFHDPRTSLHMARTPAP